MGLLLLSSSVLYITSANQINKFVNDDYGVPVNVKMLRGEKLVAGVKIIFKYFKWFWLMIRCAKIILYLFTFQTFGFVQGVLYWVVSFFVFRHG